MREILTFACFLKFGLQKFCFMCYFWLRSWVAGLQSTPSPALWLKSPDIGHRTPDRTLASWTPDIGHRTWDTGHGTPDMRHTQGTEKAQRQKLKQKVGSNFLMPDVMSGVQYPVSDVQCPMSGVYNWWLCNFFAGHRTSDNTLEFGSVPGGGGVLCNPVG